MKKFVLLLILVGYSVADFATTYYSKPSGTPLDATMLSNWTTLASGTGTVPSGFGSGDIWVVQTVGGLTTSGAWALTGTLSVTKALTITVTPTISGAIIIQSGGSLTYNTGGTVTLGGNVTNNSGTLNVASGTVDFGSSYVLSGTGVVTGSGTISTSNTITSPLSNTTYAGTVVYAATSGGQRVMTGTYNNLVISNTSGTTTAQGALTINGSLTTAAGGLFTTSYAISGTISSVSNSGTIQTSNVLPSGLTWGGTVQINASAGAVPAGTYNNLKINGSCPATGNVTVNGTLTVAASQTFDMASNALSVTGTVSNSGTIKTSNTSANPLTSGLSWGGTVNYYGTGQTIAPGTYNILINGAASGTNNAGGTLTVNSVLSVSAGSTLDMGSNLLNGTLTSNSGTGTLSTAVPTTTSSTPIPSGKTWNVAVTYAGSGGDQTVVSGTYTNLSVLGTATASVAGSGGSLTVNGGLTVAGGATLDLGSNKLMGGLTSISNSGTIKTALVNSISSATLPSSKSWGGTVEFTALTGNQTVPLGTYNNLVLDNTSGTNGAGNLVVTGSLTTTAGGTLDMGNKTLNVASATITNNGTIQTETNTAISATPLSPGKTWGGTVIYGVNTSALTLVSGTYNNLTIQNYANASGDVTVNGTLTVAAAGNLFMGTTAVLSGSLTSIQNSGLIRTSVPTSVSATPLPASKDWTAAGGTVQYLASGGAQTVVSGTYNNLTLSNNTGTTNTAGGNLVVNGTIRATTGGNLDMGNFTLSGTVSTFPGNSYVFITENTSANPFPDNLTWNNTIQYNNTTGGQTIVAGTYKTIINSNTSGTNTLNGDVTLNNTLRLLAGSSMDNAGHDITLYGHILGTGTESGSGVISVSRDVSDSGVQKFDGATVSNLTIAPGVYSTYLDSLIGNLTVTGTLSLGGQSLELGVANLNMAAGSTLSGTFGSSNMIITNSTGMLEMFENGTGSVTFPVGDGAGNYTPIVLNVTSGSFTAGVSAIGVNVSNTKASSNANTTNYINRNWNVVTTSITNPQYDVTSAQYLVSDVVGSEAALFSGQYPGSLPWTKYSVTNTGTHVLSGSGLSGTTTDITGMSFSAPTVSLAGNNFSICGSNPLDDATLTVSSSTGDPTLVYTWAPATGLSATTGLTVTAHPASNQVYTVTLTDGNGLTATATATVNVNSTANAGSISGVPDFCTGQSIIFTNATGDAGGTWSSTTGAVASINSSTGNVTGLTPGTTVISYTLTNACSTVAATFGLNVVTLASISGSSSVCLGLTTNYTDATGSFSWQSSDASIASVNGSGVVSGVTAGSATIDYYISGTGCLISKAITVNPLPTPTFTSIPSANICNPLQVTYTTQASQSAYVWNFQGTNGVDYTVVSGGTSGSNSTTLSWLTTGTKTVTANYNNSFGCTAVTSASNTSTVNTAPTVTFSSPPSGSICSSTDEVYTTQALQSNYTWSVPGILNSDYTITSGGTGTGSNTVTLKWLTSGSKNVTVNYTASNGCTGQADASSTVNNHIRPNVTFTSSLSTPFCTGTDFKYTYTTQSGQSSYIWTLTGTAGVDYTIVSGGTSTTNNTVTVAWTASGNKTVTVNYNDANSCNALTPATNTTSFNTTPNLITGTAAVCVSKTLTLSDATAGGTWSVSNTSLATIGSTTGIVTGVSAGTDTVTYTLTSSGCYETFTESVKAQPTSITGNASICPGSTSTLASTPSGGTWSSGTTGVGTINTSGVVTGVSSGTTNIIYNLSGCSASKVVTVSSSSAPAAIGGNSVICLPGTSSLTDATGGGSWSIDNTAIATVDAGGVVTGVSQGNANVSYTVGSCYVTALVTVNTVPSAISGSSSLCTANAITLSDATLGGTWTSSATGTATVGSSTGIVTGVAAGTVNITYTTSGSCRAIATVSVAANPLTANISWVGAAYSGLCIGNSITPTYSPTGGTWSSGATSIATINATTALMTGISAGSAPITYTKSGCYHTNSLSIGSPLPAISGSSTICSSSPVTMSNAVTGGTWGRNNGTGAVSITTLGVVTAVTSGAATINYGKTGCATSFAVTANTSCRIGDNGEVVVMSDGENNYSVYPNPTAGVVNILQSVPVDNVSEVTVLNYLGEMVYQGGLEFTSGKGELNLGDIANGVYFIIVKQDSEKRSFRVVVEK